MALSFTSLIAFGCLVKRRETAALSKTMNETKEFRSFFVVGQNEKW
jgi:hypothetical protein